MDTNGAPLRTTVSFSCLILPKTVCSRSSGAKVDAPSVTPTHSLNCPLRITPTPRHDSSDETLVTRKRAMRLARPITAPAVSHPRRRYHGRVSGTGLTGDVGGDFISVGTVGLSRSVMAFFLMSSSRVSVGSSALQALQIAVMTTVVGSWFGVPDSAA